MSENPFVDAAFTLKVSIHRYQTFSITLHDVVKTCMYEQMPIILLQEELKQKRCL